MRTRKSAACLHRVSRRLRDCSVNKLHGSVIRQLACQRKLAPQAGLTACRHRIRSGFFFSCQRLESRAIDRYSYVTGVSGGTIQGSEVTRAINCLLKISSRSISSFFAISQDVSLDFCHHGRISIGEVLSFPTESRNRQALVSTAACYLRRDKVSRCHDVATSSGVLVNAVLECQYFRSCQSHDPTVNGLEE